MVDQPAGSDEVPPLRQGDIIVYGPVVDPQGRNAKTRPVVVVSVDSETAVGVAITTVPPGKDDAGHVAMQWSADGRCRTGLNREAWAYAPWRIEIPVGAAFTKIGFCDARRIEAILAWSAD